MAKRHKKPVEKKTIDKKESLAFKETKAKPSSKLYWIIGLILIIVAGGIILAATLTNKDPVNTGTTGSTNTNTFSGEGILIEQYSDFECPFSKRAYPVVKQLEEYYGDQITFVYKHFPLGFHANAQNAAEASECARDQGKFTEYHDYLFEKATGFSVDNLKSYAQTLGLDSTTFNTCLDSGNKKELVTTDLSQGSARGVSGTPTFFINGEMLVGAQPIEAFIPVIDKALGKDSGILDQIHADEPAITLSVINDKNCGASCDPSRIVNALRQYFPKMTVNELDITDTDAKELISSHALEKVPAFVLSANIIDASKYKENPNFQTAFKQAGDGYKVIDEATGATRWIDPVKQAEVDAAKLEAQRQAKAKLNVGEKPQVDFFVMSYCPYGNQAEEAIEKAWKVLGDKAIFKPRYVIYSNYAGGGPNYCLDSDSQYCSMHGIQELNQNLRERCVYDDQGTEKMFAFMLAMNQDCTSQNADTCWKDVAKKIGLDTDKIAACEKEKGLDYVKEDSELNQLLGVRGSPTSFINGELYEGPRTPEGFLAALCAEFDEKPAECDEVPEEVAQGAAPEGSC